MAKIWAEKRTQDSSKQDKQQKDEPLVKNFKYRATVGIIILGTLIILAILGNTSRTTFLGASVVVAAIFFILPTLGEIYAERSGVLNLGIEGMIIASAAGSYAVAFITGSYFWGILSGIFIGAFLSFLHAILTITFNRNQIVSGIGIVFIGTGLSGFLGKDVVGIPLLGLTGLDRMKIPFLSDIPFYGPVFFNHDILVYFTYLLVFLLWFILFKTRAGIIIRTIGENPVAAQNQGINVRLIRYISVIFGGMLSGLAGAYLSLAWQGFWIDNLTGGRGWIVIALVVVALWNPLGAVVGSFLFASFEQIQFLFQSTPIPLLFPGGVPTALLKMLPSVFTIIFLGLLAIIISRQKVKSTIGAPSALAVPFED